MMAVLIGQEFVSSAALWKQGTLQNEVLVLCLIWNAESIRVAVQHCKKTLRRQEKWRQPQSHFLRAASQPGNGYYSIDTVGIKLFPSLNTRMFMNIYWVPDTGVYWQYGSLIVALYSSDYTPQSHIEVKDNSILNWLINLQIDALRRCMNLVSITSKKIKINNI